MLALRQGKPAPAIAQSTAVPASEARSLEGRYGSGDKAIELTAPNGHLYMSARRRETRRAAQTRWRLDCRRSAGLWRKSHATAGCGAHGQARASAC